MLKILSVKEAQGTILQRRPNMEPVNSKELEEAMLRIFGQPLTATQAVERVVKDVQERGDSALNFWTERIDGIQLDRFAVPLEAIKSAPARIPDELYRALLTAADRIRNFHACQPVESWRTETLGGNLGQRATPIGNVGVYVPGGTAPLPSSLLMAVIPAQIAGVQRIAVATPPSQDATVPDVILAAAQITGIENIYMLGGAQAIAALAFGSESIPRVDKIVGAGNLFVTLAKKAVFGHVGIDGLYGPTETMIIADETASAKWVAADLLAQAEHDHMASAILITPSKAFARSVQQAVDQQIKRLSRADIITSSLGNQGGIILCDDLDQAIQLANEFSAEHLCLCTTDNNGVAEKIVNAGGIFLGEKSFEVLGDYVAGPSHIMPTGGSARFSSPLNVLDFVKFISIIELDDTTADEISPIAARIAQAEGLDAHSQAARYRFAMGEQA